MKIQNPIIRGMFAVNLVFSATIISYSNQGYAQEQSIHDEAITAWNKDIAEAQQLKEQAHQKLKKDMAHVETLKKQADADLENEMQRAKNRVQNAENEEFDAAISDAKKIKNDAVTRYNHKLAEAEKLKSEASRRFVSNLDKARKKVDTIGQDAKRKFDQEETKVKSLVDGHKVTAKKAYHPKAISLAESGETLSKDDLKNITELPERIQQTKLSTRSIPLQEVPERPDTLFYLGDSFFGSGPVSKGFELPTGAVWQPQFFPFGTYSTAVQTSDDGNQQVSEWVNSLDIYGNLNLTPTERLLIGFTPFDNNGQFSGYNMYPQGEGVDATNGHVQVLFFEGRFDSLFPGLKSSTGNWASFDFALGRQPVNYQSGILINDTIDSVGITRTSLNLFGSAEATITGLFGWNFINRNDNIRDDKAKLIGLFSTFNYAEHQIEADIVVVYDVDDSNPSNGLNFAFSSYQQLWGVLNTTFSYNQSIGLNKNTSLSQTGALLLSQFNLTPPYTVDNAYMNVFWGIGEFTSAARNANAGGPLGQVGLLFSASGLGSYGPALSNDAQNTFGGAIGYERYLGSIHRKIIFEFGGVTKDSAIAFGAQFEQALGSNFLWTLGSYVSHQENHKRSVGYGVRSVFSVFF